MIPGLEGRDDFTDLIAKIVTGAHEPALFEDDTEEPDEDALDFWKSSSLWGDEPKWRGQERDEQREVELGREIFEQTTPGSSASFQAAQQATAFTDPWGGHDNGRIPTNQMTPIEKGVHFMRDDAAQAYKAMQKAMKKDLGYGFSITDSYRDYDTQVRLKGEKPTLAATPGSSRHGWGLALDINVNDPKTLEWLRANGATYGFHELEGEPWHWDYEGGFEGETPAPKKEPRPRKRLEGRKARRSIAAEKDDTRKLQSRNLSFDAALMNVLDEDTDSPFYDRTQPEAKERQRMQRKAGQFLKMAPAPMRKWFRQAAKETGLPVGLLVLVAQKESGFNPDAVSSAGAQGVMQIMPLHNLADPFDAQNNILFGANLLANYISQMGSVRLGLAAYNAGPNNHEAGLDYADSILEIWRNR